MFSPPYFSGFSTNFLEVFLAVLLLGLLAAFLTELLGCLVLHLLIIASAFYFTILFSSEFSVSLLSLFSVHHGVDHRALNAGVTENICDIRV